MIGSKRRSSQRTAATFSGTGRVDDALQLGAEHLDVVQHPARLVLARDQPGEAGEPLGVVAVLDDLGHVAQARPVAARDDLHLLDLEPELVEPLEAGTDRA